MFFPKFYTVQWKTFGKLQKNFNVVTQQKSDLSDLQCQQIVTAVYFSLFWDAMIEVVKGSSREIRQVSILSGCQADFCCWSRKRTFVSLTVTEIFRGAFVCLTLWLSSPWFTLKLWLDSKSIGELHGEVICIYTRTCIYIFIYISIHTCIYILIYIYISIYIYTGKTGSCFKKKEGLI